MLEPRDRELLTNALRPPDGYELDFAIGTTFSLDLLTLLTVPLSFAWFDQHDDEDTVNSIQLLGSLQKYAKKLVIFCQAGFIAWPRQRYPQIAFLEESVAECSAPRSGVFHPKVWLLRYVSEDGDTVYRMLCLSRNLTMARSWDTVLALDGRRGSKRVAASQPLADFVAALPRMAVRGVSPEKAGAVLQLAEELRQVTFECPDGFEDFEFVPIGFDRYRAWPVSEAGQRLLVVSPFLAIGTLEQLSKSAGNAVLVSTRLGLEELPRQPGGFTEFYTLDDRAVADFAEGSSDSAEGEGSAADSVQLAGLHAKLYVVDRGARTDVWTGSANATDAAFNINVEFLVKLTGQRNRIGIDKLLSSGGDSSTLRDILIEAGGAVATKIHSEEEVSGELRLESARIWMATQAFSLLVSAADERFDVTLVSPASVSTGPDGVQIRCWLNTMSADQSIALVGAEPIVRFESVSFEALTPFLAVEIATTIAGTRRTVRFVLNLPLVGAPADRHDRILQSLINSRSRFTSYLWMLLSDAAAWMTAAGPLALVNDAQESPGQRPMNDSEPIFELLVRTLDRHPERLDDVAALMKRVGRIGDDGEPLLPPGFEELWAPIWAVRERMKGMQRGD